MIQANSPRKVGVWLLSLLMGIAFVGPVAIVQAGGPPPQGKPTPAESTDKPSETAEKAEESSTSTAPAAPANPAETPEIPPRFPLPSARVAGVNGVVTLKLMNQTNAVINYQIVAGTRERSLGEQSQVELQSLSMPLTLTYQRQDNGLLLVIPKSTEPGVLEVRFEATNDFSLDTKALEVNQTGAVFLN
ncbi:MAG: hypothetical protein ACRC8A_19695 [Microcoleaceae cyanobacterium]